MLLYLGRLIILDATDPIVVTAALLTGLVASPAWFIWMGMSLRRTT